MFKQVFRMFGVENAIFTQVAAQDDLTRNRPVG